MRWPLMWRSTHDLKLERVSAQLTTAAVNFQHAAMERRYWQERAERLLEHGRFKRGEITSPVFQDPPAKKASDDGPTRLFEALRHTEIESRPAAPVTPMG